MLDKLSKKTLIVFLIVFYVLLYIFLKFIIVYCQDLFMSNDVFLKKYEDAKVLKIESYSTDKRKETDYFSNKSDQYKIKVKNYFCR